MGLSNKEKQARYRERKAWLEREVEQLQHEIERLKLYIGDLEGKPYWGSIAAKHTPPNVTVKYHNSGDGHALVKQRKIFVPYPTARDRLFIYLHEVAHVVLKHTGKKPVHVQEMEAQQWAIRVMREERMPVPARRWNRPSGTCAARSGRPSSAVSPSTRPPAGLCDWGRSGRPACACRGAAWVAPAAATACTGRALCPPAQHSVAYLPHFAAASGLPPAQNPRCWSRSPRRAVAAGV
jgi:hypothetical protein